MVTLRKHKKTRCPSCDHRNPVEAVRCEICTRMLSADAEPQQQAYEDTLWSEPVSTRHVPRKRSGFSLGLFCLVAFLGLGAANYIITGTVVPYPLQERLAPKGSTWKTYDGDPTYRALLPGDPAAATVVGPTGGMNTAAVWVDSRWNAIRDVNTISPAKLRLAREELYAGLVIASAPDTDDARLVVPEALLAMRPGIALSEPVIGGVERDADGERFDVTADYAGWPDASGNGTVTARFESRNGVMYVIATYFAEGVEEDLQESLVDGVEFS